ncbi:hypothetical protein [Nocardia aurantia]|uniref:Uncharacterized protein n=1 Tax=Nocardia aurantia TaxID=2585199 RepID=A0A7K0DZZ3_9NOCA|nr:hypothetical protein [Nocardia aurantia]MQY30842.1 hypothetical protein [Nocardia aurantia]
MVLDIFVSIACTVILTTACWLLSGNSTGSQVKPKRFRSPAPPVAGPPSAETPAGSDEPTLEWADPAQIWPALRAANILLAARLGGRISADEYRWRTAELARKCEPQAPQSAAGTE